MIDARARELATMPYEDYLRTPEWRERSAACKAAAGHRCQLCYAPGALQAHHRTYERRGHEEPGDLIALCDSCHRTHHNHMRKGAKPAAVGVVRNVSGATLWTLPRVPVRATPAVYRPNLMVLHHTRRRWGRVRWTTRVSVALLAVGSALLFVTSHIHPA